MPKFRPKVTEIEAFQFTGEPSLIEMAEHWGFIFKEHVTTGYWGTYVFDYRLLAYKQWLIKCGDDFKALSDREFQEKYEEIKISNTYYFGRASGFLAL